MKKTIQFTILLVIALFTSPLMWAQTVVTSSAPSALSTSNGYITYTNSGIDGIDVPPHPLLNFQGDFTISLKVKFDDVSAWNMLFSYVIYGGLEFSYTGNGSYNPHTLQFTTDGSSVHVTSAVTWYPNNNQWYQIVLTKQGTTYTTYVDGAIIGTTSSSYAVTNFSSVNMRIGNYGSQGLYFKGEMDEVSN